MAVIPCVPGLEVTVLVYDQPLPEHEPPQSTADQAPNKNTVAKFIESHNNEVFSILVSANSQYAWDSPNHALRAQLHIDGRYAGNWIFGCEEGGVGFHEVTYFDFKKKEWLERKMQFSAVNIVEEDNKPNSFARDTKHDVQNKPFATLGTITVEIFRGIASDCPRPAEPIGQIDTSMTGVVEMEEKSLKGRVVTHASTFSDPRPVAAPTTIKFERLREDRGKPIATFKFLYRSREGLRMEGVLPCSLPVRIDTHSTISHLADSRRVYKPINHHTKKSRIKREPTSDDEMEDQEDSGLNKENKPRPSANQHSLREYISTPFFTKKPRRTCKPAPARLSAFPYHTLMRQNTNNSSAPATASRGSSSFTASTSSSASASFGFSSGFSSPSPATARALTPARHCTSTASTPPPSLPPMFLKMQKHHKKQQNRAFMAAFSRTAPFRSISGSSSTSRFLFTSS